MDFETWAKDRPLGKPGTMGYMMAEAAWDAAVAAERERWEPLRRLWPLIERGTKDFVFTAEQAGEVAADMAALRKALDA